MKISLNKIQFLLFALLLLALTGCGATSTNTAGNTALPLSAKLTAKLDWSSANKSVAKSVSNTPPPLSGVTSVRLMITGPIVPVIRQTFTHTASTMNVDVYPSDDLVVTALALDSSGNTVFEGLATHVIVTAGNITNVPPITMIPPVTKAADLRCFACHETTRDETGHNLVSSFKQSGHYTNNSWVDNSKNYPIVGTIRGTGCAGCHGPAHNDVNPAASGRCYECHNYPDSIDLKHNNPDSALGADFDARYLSIGNNNCSSCHEPHNPTYGTGYQQRKDWAKSGHGDTSSAAWTHFDFTVENSCNACHTPDGFIKALGNGWTNTDASSTTVSSVKQPLGCNACHSSNDFKNSVRTISGGYSAGMGGFGSSATNSIQYPNVGESNICIPCHASRENGASINDHKTDFTNTYFKDKDPHGLSAAAVFYGKGGFQFYTSGVRYNTYGAAGKVGRNANWSHGKLGMDNYSAVEARTAGVTLNTGNKGQCVACHLGPKANHTFSALSSARATQGTSDKNKGCYGCHNDETMTVLVNGERIIWDRLFDFFAWNFEYKADGTGPRSNPIYYLPSMYTPFWSTKALYGETKDWTKLVPNGTGPETMGAAMNLRLLAAEKGSFVHNRNFGRALIADSIVYLQKGSVGDRSVKTTNPNDIVSFTAYSTAYPSHPSVSISDLKAKLTKFDSATGKYIRR